MLLIGSRAIRFYFPEFRKPRDWDLVGTQADIERLAKHLPYAGAQRPEKAHFRLRGRLVEVANASVVPYWGRVLEAFDQCPTLMVEGLGQLDIAPVGYLLLTKQCGLIYHIVHWHKNLEDLYFLRDRVPTLPPSVAGLVTETVADSARMFAQGHRASVRRALTCHPDAPKLQRPDRHSDLHRRLALGHAPARDLVCAWQGFTEHAVADRKALMLRLIAEEAMVVAAQAWIERSLHASASGQPPEQWLRWALRSLCIGELPEGLRYFVVNYYREILELIPDNWQAAFEDLLAHKASELLLCSGRAEIERVNSRVSLPERWACSD